MSVRKTLNITSQRPTLHIHRHKGFSENQIFINPLRTAYVTFPKKVEHHDQHVFMSID